MNSSDSFDDQDDLDTLLRQALQSAYGRAEPSPSLWPRLAARLAAPAPQRGPSIASAQLLFVVTTVIALAAGLLHPAPAVTVARLQLAPPARTISLAQAQPSLSMRRQMLIEAELTAGTGQLALAAPPRETLVPVQPNGRPRPR